jgi:hypothetical protein
LTEQQKQNTVDGHPEPEFRVLWVAMLWQAMLTARRGYRRRSLRHTGKGTDRRADKLEAIERHKRAPVFTGKLNYRRSERAQQV